MLKVWSAGKDRNFAFVKSYENVFFLKRLEMKTMQWKKKKRGKPRGQILISPLNLQAE